MKFIIKVIFAGCVIAAIWVDSSSWKLVMTIFSILAIITTLEKPKEAN